MRMPVRAVAAVLAIIGWASAGLFHSGCGRVPKNEGPAVKDHAAAPHKPPDPGPSKKAVMDYFGVIRTKPGGVPLTYEAWCALVESRMDLIRTKPRIGRNPLTGKEMTIKPRPDAASVVVDGRQLGSVAWSQTDTNEVIVQGDTEQIIAWARALAESLGADFEEMRE